jgi:rod shape-determining protein MreC
METLLNRYRNITVLLLVILAQLVLIAVQVRNDQDVRMVRVWSVTAITPLAKVLETARSGTSGFFHNYIFMHDAREDNRRLQAEVDKLKIENVFLKTEISTADRAKALVAFQSRTPSKTIGARVIAAGAGASSKVVFIDRGSVSGVEKGMAVVTPDGIVGKVIAAYPTASEVMLATDPEFAAGVVSQKNHATGTLKGQGQSNCKVDYVPNEEKVDVGEWFYTSGEDRIFPKGFPVGVVRVVRKGSPYQEVIVEPSAFEQPLEAVLIVIEGVHQAIPEAPPANAPVYVGTAPPTASGEPVATPASPGGTDADRLLQKYKKIGEAENHKYGEGLPGSPPPDFNKVPAAPATAAPTVPPQATEGASGRAGETAKKPSTTMTTRPTVPPQATEGASGRAGETAKKTVTTSTTRRTAPSAAPPPQSPPQEQ